MTGELGKGDRQPDVPVVPLQPAIDLVPEQGAKSGIGESLDVQFRPSRVVEPAAHAPAIANLAILEGLEGLDHAGTERRIERVVVDTDVMAQIVQVHRA